MTMFSELLARLKRAGVEAGKEGAIALHMHNYKFSSDGRTELGAAGLPYSEPSDYAAVPPNQFGCLFLPDRTQKGYHVEELADGAYYVSNGAYDAMFIRTGNGVIAVDAPATLGKSCSRRSRR
jgi:hypothetical protein